MRESFEPTQPGESGRARALRILAKSVFKELRAAGYDRRDMVRLANELLELVSDELRATSDGDPPSAS